MSLRCAVGGRSLKNINDGCPYNASAFVKTKECRLRFDSVAQPTRGQQGWTYLNFVHTSLQGELLPVQRRFLLCFGRLNVALLFVKEVIWKFVTGFVSEKKSKVIMDLLLAGHNVKFVQVFFEIWPRCAHLTEMGDSCRYVEIFGCLWRQINANVESSGVNNLRFSFWCGVCYCWDNGSILSIVNS